MEHFLKHKLIVATIVIQLIALPLILFAVKQNQETRTQATKSTSLFFTPSSTTTTPISKNAGESFSVDMMMNPGTNLVSLAKIEVTFDPTKVKLAATNPVTVNTAAFPVTVEGPVITNGKVQLIVSVGSDQTKVIQAETKVLTLNMQAVTATNQTQIAFGTNNSLLSIAPQDSANENVLSTTTPAIIKVNAAPTSTPTPNPTSTPTPTRAPSPTPTVAPFRITGKHVDASGNLVSLSGQSVTITNLSNNSSQTKATSSWTFDNLPRADYRITANPIPGYQIEHMVCYDCMDTDRFFSSNTFIINKTNISYVGITFKYTPAPTKIPTITPAPTNEPTPGTTSIFFARLKLHGLGHGGDSPNPNSIGTLNPIRNVRDLTAEIYSTSGVLVTSSKGYMKYSVPEEGVFNGLVELPSTLATGDYIIKIKTPYYLRKQLPGFMRITKGQGHEAQSVALIAGDVNQDNALSVADYDLIIDCYSDLEPAKNCTPAKLLAADISDDGKVNQDDYNLFLRELSIQQGE